jgi:chromate reductase, NAD(P)H dehydrogenase (quinone)
LLVKIVGLVGSLRVGSFNARLMQAAVAAVPEGVQLSVAPIAEIPLYNEDLIVDSMLPAAVETLKALIAASDGLLIATPEYNNGVPGVLKNALDWLSVPREDIARVFGGKPVAVMGASIGDFGTVMSQAALLPILRALALQPWFGMRSPHVGKAHEVFDEQGQIANPAIAGHVRAFVTGFCAFASAARDSREE